MPGAAAVFDIVLLPDSPNLHPRNGKLLAHLGQPMAGKE
jgi:hypothetical protein